VQAYTSWGPVSRLLNYHQKLTDDAFWMCEMASEGMNAITGFGGTWQPLNRGTCTGARALTKMVLSTVLIFYLFMPCLLVYMFEREAKLTFLARLQPYRHQRRFVNVGFTIYMAAGVALLVVSDLLVDAVHELGLAPELHSAGGL
jgi:hypothetical protein